MIQDRRKVLQTFLVLIFSFAACLSVYPQVAGGTFSGTVTDSSGAVIPGAQISILNVATGITRAVRADAAGSYTAPNLLPGIYEMTASAPGFATEVRSGTTLTVGATQVLNLIMRVGTMTEKIEVTGEAPDLQLATSSISAVVNSTTVRELPLNGRSWSDLATLQPGVVAVRTDRKLDVLRGFGADAAISGARPQQNSYRLDGINVNDHTNGAPGSVLGGNLGVDAVEEFSVLTSNYSAEYGRTSGGVVNASTRSGTNQFHGGVYEFLRNSALDARNFFDRGSIPPFKRNQFGASAGGPIRKDRTFIFGDYEGIRQSKGITNVDTVPSPAARGIGPNGQPTVAVVNGSPLPASGQPGAAQNPDPTTHIDMAVQKYLPFWPAPNGGIKPGTNGNIGIYTFASQEIVSENFFITRVDHRLSDRDSLFGTYTYDKSSFASPDNLNTAITGDNTLRQVAILEETHTFNPTLLNAIRFGFNRPYRIAGQSVKAINPLVTDLSLGAVPGRPPVNTFVPGLSTFAGGLPRAISRFTWNSFQVYDDAFLTKGVHSMKFGAALERPQLNSLAETDVNGLITFGNLRGFLLNQPARFSTAFPGTTTSRAFRQAIFGLYVQDDWRWRPNLTLNLGLRYEMTTVPTENRGKIATLINLTDTQPHLGDPFFSNPTLRNFEPRVGFAWDPFRDNKSVLRGGFGMYDVLPLPYEFVLTTYTSTPFFELGSASKLPAGSFYTGAFPLLRPTSAEVTSIQQHPHRNYVMQWNLNIQRELTPNLTGMIGYVGSHGVHQPFRSDDVDIVLPKLTPFGYLWPAPVGSGTKINPNFGSIRDLRWVGDSSFNAFEAQITKRMSHGLQLQGSFTWGKSIDTSSSTEAGNQFTNSISSSFWPNLAVGRGVSDFNVSRTLVISGTWQVPIPGSVSGPAARIVGGWELGGIYTASDGVPTTPTLGTDADPLGQSNNDPWDFPNRLGGPGCSSLINPGNPNNYIKTQCFALPTAPNMAFWQANCDTTSNIYGPNLTTEPFPVCLNLRGNAGRNILTGPGTSNLDFSIFKNNPIKRISESFNMQFRAEFFNLLNHPNFAVPVMPDNTDIFDSTGTPTGVAGLITSTTTTEREIQFALKIVW
jgi:hypothetical protein